MGLRWQRLPRCEREQGGCGLDRQTFVKYYTLKLLDPGSSRFVFTRSLSLNLREIWVVNDLLMQCNCAICLGLSGWVKARMASVEHQLHSRD